MDNTSIENLANGESETFTVTYTFAATVDKLGLNSANITVTPTYDEGDAKTYVVSATSNATMTLDEDNPTTLNYGSKAFLHVKYTPSNGWKAYTLSSYSDGTLSFSKVSGSTTISNRTPYLVYIEEASNHPNGVLLSDIVTNGNTPDQTTKGDATFQGTYVRKDYVENDDWYGVTPSGRIMKAGTGAFVKGYRAYFTGVSAPSAGAEVKMFIIGGDDIPTDVGFVKMVDADAKEVYNLAGQRIQKARKGIYIVNGKKVVIK